MSIIPNLGGRGYGFSVYFDYVSFCHFVKNRLLFVVCQQNVHTHLLKSTSTHNHFSKRLKSEKKQCRGRGDIQRASSMAEPYSVHQPAKTHAFTTMEKTYITEFLSKIFLKLQFIQRRLNFLISL